jgi:glycosyltransferase involved in cell wall biosynthesis
MRVAVIHDWLVAKGGAERVLEAILECYPEAEVFTTVDFMAEPERAFLRRHRVHVSFVQRLPFAKRRYRSYWPLMPLAVESFDVSSFDLVISSSASVAKGVLCKPEQMHVCYIHSPMRYAWDLQNEYLREANLDRGLRGVLARLTLQRMRQWDAHTANGVDVFISNSRFVAQRVWRAYRRESAVIYPPVDTTYFEPGHAPREDFYLTASRLVPYKRVGLIVDAFAAMPQRRLVVIGDGPEFAQLARRAPANVTMLGHQPAETLRDRMQRARAFVFAALEDFGIAPVEAQACGTPVLAYGRGGVTESVVDGRTGLWFAEQSAAAIVDAVERFERSTVAANVAGIRANAVRFGAARFREQLREAVGAELARTAAAHGEWQGGRSAVGTQR